MTPDPLDIVLPDDLDSYAEREIPICQRKLAQATDALSRYYYQQCLKGHRANLAKQRRIAGGVQQPAKV